MDLISATAGVNASGRCIVRGERLARVKFVALPMDATPEPRLRVALFSKFVLRVIGRLVAARP